MGEYTFMTGERIDIDRLFQMAAQKSREGRDRLYRNLWDLFESRGDSLTAEERRILLDILRQLSHDVEMAVRVQLAKRLAERPDAPHDLVVMLANDEIEIAYPVLLQSGVLKDVDLIEIVKQRMQQHRLAVATRRNIGNDVCRALVDTADAAAIHALLNNHTATPGDQLLAELVERSRREPELQEPLLGRPDLPEALAERMFFWVSAALRTFIAERYPIDVDALDDAIAGAAEAALADQPTPNLAQRLIDKLDAGGQLGPGFLVKSVREGQIELFELAFAKISGLRPKLMRRIIYEPGGEALALACRAIKLDRAVFLTILHLTRHATADATIAQIAQRDFSHFYDHLQPDHARRVLLKWLRNPGYLAALKQFGVER
jgi:uncharacterized protein (DUF2336 family)